MNFKLSLSITAVATTLLCQAVFAEKNEITFKNQRGSVLELNILADNKIAGYFTTAVASKTCPEAVNKKRPITGYLIGNAITFSVVYPMCESVLSVSGNFDNEKKSIDTLAILNKQATDVTHEGPGARFIGHDSYQKIG
ncbi:MULTISPECIES: avidin/streptavidin family protein [unclassified Legionella]|uniref:avidin/streptavidin family protein n=1 Tax=unclassified Legionella TaxID=2622702 RepID=UPI0010554805|nr:MULTISPECIES: avidin/streptavidin family protein [unclassified Legionella]MDI9819768.1 avidin/streptavidin family protein [Legionella sp. PL877]